MQTIKILVISLLAAVAIGSVGGILIGKYLAKRARSSRKALLSKKESIIYSACILLGMGLILFGLFFKFPGNENLAMTEEGAFGGQNAAQAGAAPSAGSVRRGSGGAVMVRMR